ncbi:MAG: response regulator transcription factor [Synergistetes bacterium]|nr:response regulator transcription factor [Synergistota bacterium]
MEKKIRVVIADDMEETRKSLKVMLSFASDLEVVGEASDGEEALKMVRELKPDVVLMDINMPNVDGISVSKRLLQEDPDIAIVAISIQGDEEYERALEEMGVEEFLVKPFSSSRLIETIREVVQRRERKE